MAFDPQIAVVTTTSIAPNTTANVAVYWLTALPVDNSYAAVCSIADPSGFLVVQNYAYLQNGAGILVNVKNNDSVAHTGTISAIGIALPTTTGLQSQINSLTARVGAIDGQGLTDPSTAIDTVLQNQINGLNTTLSASILKMEQLYQTLQATVLSLQSTLNSHLGG